MAETVLAERLSHMKSGMLWPYAGPGGLGIQATVSKQWGHSQLNPEDFSNRGVRENNAAIICQQVRSPGRAEPDAPSGSSTGSSFRRRPASDRHSDKMSGGNTGMFVCFRVQKWGRVSTFITGPNTDEEETTAVPWRNFYTLDLFKFAGLREAWKLDMHFHFGCQQRSSQSN